MTLQRLARITVLCGILGLGFAACAVDPIAGGRITALPSQPTASYRVVECVITNGQKRVRLDKPVWYYVGYDAAGPLVFEKGPTGRVVAFDNRWTDKRGSHSLVWVHGGQYGYHIIRPWVASKPAERILWLRKDLRQSEGLWRPRPKGVPHARCPMERQKKVVEPRPAVAR